MAALVEADSLFKSLRSQHSKVVPLCAHCLPGVCTIVCTLPTWCVYHCVHTTYLVCVPYAVQGFLILRREKIPSAVATASLGAEQTNDIFTLVVSSFSDLLLFSLQEC